MKKLALIISSMACMLMGSAALSAQDISSEMCVVTIQREGFRHVPDHAEYGCASWSNLLYVSPGLSLSEAFDKAQNDPNVTYFFYTKGWQMVLVNEQGDYRVFHHGDTAFFSGTPWWGTAPGLADGYVKE